MTDENEGFDVKFIEIERKVTKKSTEPEREGEKRKK